jgi:predicted O-methyltransferase YrrM
LPAGATFVTVEIDPQRAAQAREALAGTRAEVLEGDWRDHLPQRAPFDALFADGGVGYDQVADLLAPGGVIVKDDLTPGGATEGDPTREALLLDPRLEATEILVTPEMAVIVAVRRS